MALKILARPGFLRWLSVRGRRSRSDGGKRGVSILSFIFVHFWPFLKYELIFRPFSALPEAFNSRKGQRTNQKYRLEEAELRKADLTVGVK